MKKGEPYAGGLTLNFFKSTEFEVQDPDAPLEDIHIQVRNLLRFLMNGWSEQWRNILSTRLLKAIVIERDHELTKAMRLAFQQGFNHIFSQLEGQQLTPMQHNQALLYISNCLCVLPFSDITPYESFAIPQYIDNAWQMVEYKVTPIELTPRHGIEGLVLQDADRVYAYGLEPIRQPHAEPHLIFMGTTYMAGQGHHAMVDTDLEAFQTVGNKLYQSGQQNITRWLDRQHPKKTHVCGTSLGGALSLLLAVHQGEKLSRVDALNPPGLYKPWRGESEDPWQDLEVKPEVYIQKQGDDPVSRFGVWKPEWHVLHVIPPADKKGPNGIVDHAINYAGLAESQFIGVDTLEDNEEREQRNFWLYSLLRGIFYYTIMMPIYYALRPLVRFVFSHKLQVALLIPMMALFYFLPIIPFVISSSLVFNALIYGLLSSQLLSELIAGVVDYFTDQQQANITKFMHAIAENSLLGIGLGLSAASLVMLLIASPSLIPMGLIILSLLPVTYNLFNSGKENVQIFLGECAFEPSTIHQPHLPRNESLDIYSQVMEATFTSEEIQTYEEMVRSFQEDNAPMDESSALSELDILKVEKDEAAVKVTASKAKIYEMQQTIHLRTRFGFYQAHELKAELYENQQQYQAGKRPAPSF